MPGNSSMRVRLISIVNPFDPFSITAIYRETIAHVYHKFWCSIYIRGLRKRRRYIPSQLTNAYVFM